MTQFRVVSFRRHGNKVVPTSPLWGPWNPLADVCPSTSVSDRRPDFGLPFGVFSPDLGG
jgi:hypothetical protein